MNGHGGQLAGPVQHAFPDGHLGIEHDVFRAQRPAGLNVRGGGVQVLLRQMPSFAGHGCPGQPQVQSSASRRVVSPGPQQSPGEFSGVIDSSRRCEHLDEYLAGIQPDGTADAEFQSTPQKLLSSAQRRLP